MRVLVVDDHPVVCDSFGKYLEQVGSQVTAAPLFVSCVFTLADAIKAVSVDAERPDIVFLDLNLDAQNKSVVTLENFQKHNQHQIPVVVFTGLSLSDPETVVVLRRCLNEFGAQTILMKGTSLENMFIGLPRILAFEKWLSNELINALIATPIPTANESLGLSPRQWDVARGLARGLRNKDIAKELNISPGNVQQITGAIYKRLGVHSRLQVSIRINEHSLSSPSLG